MSKTTVMTDKDWLKWQDENPGTKETVKCKWITCYAGTGLAGNGCCFAGGDWTREDCPKFIDEVEWVKEQESSA